MSLRSMAAAAPAESPRQAASVDVSSYFGEPEGTSVLEFVEPSIAGLFRVPEVSQDIRTAYPGWPETLTMTLAMLSVAHTAPIDVGDPLKKGAEEPMSTAEFYCSLAARNGRMVTYIAGEFSRAFPQMADAQAAVEKRKKELKGSHSFPGPEAVPEVPAPSPV